MILIIQLNNYYHYIITMPVLLNAFDLCKKTNEIVNDLDQKRKNEIAENDLKMYEKCINDIENASKHGLFEIYCYYLSEYYVMLLREANYTVTDNPSFGEWAPHADDMYIVSWKNPK